MKDVGLWVRERDGSGNDWGRDLFAWELHDLLQELKEFLRLTDFLRYAKMGIRSKASLKNADKWNYHKMIEGQVASRKSGITRSLCSALARGAIHDRLPTKSNLKKGEC